MKMVQCEGPHCETTAPAESVFGNAPPAWSTLKQLTTPDRHFCSVRCLVAAAASVDDVKQDLKVETRLRDKDRAGL